jgi:hypothetical protein
VKRLGADAPAVAAFYLTSNDAKYVRAKHPLNLLVLEAEKFHTEWLTGRTSTSFDAKDVELRQRTVDVWKPIYDRGVREHGGES